VLEAQLVEGILSGVDVRVQLVEGRLEGERRRIAETSPGSMITATITAARIGEPDVGIFVDEGPDELGEGGVDKVVDQSDNGGPSGGSVAGHVQLHHAEHLHALLLVVAGNGLRTQQTTFLSSIGMEFNVTEATEVVLDEDTEKLPRRSWIQRRRRRHQGISLWDLRRWNLRGRPR